MEDCFKDDPLLIVNTKLCDDEAQSVQIDKTDMDSLDKAPKELGRNTQKELDNEDQKDSETEIEPKADQPNSLYLAFSHLINLANNLGCVQRPTSTPENKVCSFLKHEMLFVEKSKNPYL